VLDQWISGYASREQECATPTPRWTPEHRMNMLNLNTMRIMTCNGPIRCPSSWTPEHRMRSLSSLFSPVQSHVPWPNSARNCQQLPQRATTRPKGQKSRFSPSACHRMPFLYLARCGGSGRKMHDSRAFFPSAPFPLLARCANFPSIIEKLRAYPLSKAWTAEHRIAKYRISALNAGGNQFFLSDAEAIIACKRP
jgi:hypothetical protein